MMYLEIWKFCLKIRRRLEKQRQTNGIDCSAIMGMTLSLSAKGTLEKCHLKRLFQGVILMKTDIKQLLTKIELLMVELGSKEEMVNHY